MANIGEPQRIIIAEPLADPVPREFPLVPEPEVVPEREPEKVPADWAAAYVEAGYAPYSDMNAWAADLERQLASMGWRLTGIHRYE